MLSIVKLPAPSLRERSRELTKDELLSPQTQALIRDMIPTMYREEGIGLAAPQVGHNIRLCIIGKDSDKSLKDDLVLVNPAYERISRKTNTDTEGCLSVPYKFGKEKRLTDIAVTAWDAQGRELKFDARKFFARVIQHEVDHLNGALFIDKATDIYEVTPEDRMDRIKMIKEDRNKTPNS